MCLGWIYDTYRDPSPVMQTASAISALASCLVALRLCFARDNLAIAIREELVNDVFIDEDFPTQTTVVYVTEHEKMQYITAV